MDVKVHCLISVELCKENFSVLGVNSTKTHCLNKSQPIQTLFLALYEIGKW